MPTLTRLGLTLAAGLALLGWGAGCGPTGGGQNNNQLPPRDAGLDAAAPDAARVDAAGPDAAPPPDAAVTPDANNLVDAAGVNLWQVKAVNSLLLADPTCLATHPTLPTTLAVLPAATGSNKNMVVFRSSDGLTFTPVTIVSFSDTPGFFGTPRGLAYDPRDGAVLVAALEPVPPPNTELAMVLAWSDNGGASFTYPWTPWATPWPPQEMRFVDGSPSALLWRSADRFHYSSDHGVSFPRVEILDPLPTGCTQILGFDMPRNNHDKVALWCEGGGAHLCDLVTDQCNALPLAGTAVALRYAVNNPLVLYALTTDRVWRSDDAGYTFDPIHAFSGTVIRVDPASEARVCVLHAATGALRCTRDGGATWMDLPPPVLQGGLPTLILDFAFTADGRLWAVGHPGVVSNTAF